jgi:Cu/Ag efflux protein CusF
MDFMTLYRSLFAVCVALLLASIVGCDWGERKPAASPEPRADSTQATGAPAAPASESYTFHGTPLAIDTVRGIITIDHEKIGDLMDAMTMPFPVADRALLKQVTIGKPTHFTIVVDSSRMQIVKIQEGHDPGHEH